MANRIGWLVFWMIQVGVCLPVVAAEPPAATLLDLAHAFREYERALVVKPFSDDQEAVRANQALDRIALNFFTRDFSGAIKGIHEEQIYRIRGRRGNDVEQVLLSLQVDTDPAEVVPATSAPRLLIHGMYAPDIAAPVSTTAILEFRRRGGSETARVTIPLELAPNKILSTECPLPETVRRALDTTWDCEWHDESGFVARARPVHVLRESRSDVFRRLEARIDKVADRPGDSRWNDALAACRRRIEVFQGTTPTSELDLWVLGPIVFRTELESDLHEFEHDRNPYQRRIGDRWLPIPLGDEVVATRIYAPPAATPPRPLPVVVALHGAGGNEHMFFETLGAGRIKVLAERHQFLAVAPATMTILRHSSAFPQFIEQLSRFHDIDPRRVYVIGHSMGAFAASQLAALHPTTIRAVSLVAGGPRLPILTPSFPSTRVFLPELDMIVPGAPLRAATARSRKRGVPIEVHEVPHYGHVLAVGKVLDDAISWMLTQAPSNSQQ